MISRLPGESVRGLFPLSLGGRGVRGEGEVFTDESA
jgi:hypothetical protein